MDYKKLGLGLGLFSVTLGAAGLLAPRKVTRALDSEGNEGAVRAIGARDLAVGLSILSQPAVATGLWARVAGDAMDLGTLAMAARKAPGNRALWGAAALVAASTLVDLLAARGLDRQTGKTFPLREHATA